MKWFLTITLVLLLLLHQETAATAAASYVTTAAASCPSSSCGKITNIKYPFRLPDIQPAACGLPGYELVCENNRTLSLSLFPGKNYKVKAINYDNFTVRVVDPGIKDSDCSSIPRYFLSKPNFTSSYNLDYHDDLYEVHLELELSYVIYLNCSSSKSNYYIGNIPCLSRGNNSKSNSKSKGHIYAVAGDLKAGDMKDDCRIMLVAPTSLISNTVDKRNETYSYAEIHRMLVYGFEISWGSGRFCRGHCARPDCILTYTEEGILCDNDRFCFSPLGYYVECEKMSKGRMFVEDIILGIAQGLLQPVRVMIIDRSDGIVSSKLGLQIGRVTAKYVLLPYIALRFMIGLIVFIGKLIHIYWTRHSSLYENIEDFLQGNSLAPIRYSYKEIKRMSKGFKVKLGEGGYGSVYKGKLRSGPLAAIKMLNKPKANGQEFISEVATIGRIHHANVVQLIGFCVEGSKRALVYEFMPNGSLDKYISSDEDGVSLTYDQMYTISLGVARGIEYLHQGCDMQILHFDIKPHNILLDENFTPKVSDFGLAKLYPFDNSVVSLTAARGTIGYMAPELFYQNIGPVSYKADVYSFGMLLMEMANRRRNLNPHADHSSQVFFPYWIYNQLIEEREIEMGEITNQEKNTVKKMFLVALWCIQLTPKNRPSMKKVIEMLEGDIESITMPPEPSPYPTEIEINSDESISTDTYSSTSFLEEHIEYPLLKDSS